MNSQQQQQIEIEDDEQQPSEVQVRSFFVRALYDFTSDDASSLSFQRGALIEVLTQLESGWWDGLLGNDVRGWFPSNYVEQISDQQAELLLAQEGTNHDYNHHHHHHHHPEDGQGQVSGLENAISLSTTTYHPQLTQQETLSGRLPQDSFSGLGLAGQDLDGLRQLIGDSTNLIDGTNGRGGLDPNSDPFEQLAQAAMLDDNGGNGLGDYEQPSHDDYGENSIGGRAGGVTGGGMRTNVNSSSKWRNSSQAAAVSPSIGHFNNSSSSSSASEQGGNTSSSILNPTRSASTSISTMDMDGPKGRIRTTSTNSITSPISNHPNNRSSLLPQSNNNSNQVRSRSATQSDQQFNPTTRERAASASVTSSSAHQDHNINHASSSSSPKKSGRKSSGKRRDLKKRQSESDFWVPKFVGGEIVYHNSRTGVQSHEIPEGSNKDWGESLAGSNQVSEDESGSETSSLNSMNIQSSTRLRKNNLESTRPTSTIYVTTDEAGNSRSSSRPSTANSSVGTATGTSTFVNFENLIENAPNPDTIPFPWKIKTSDDEKSFYYFNSQTREIRSDLPSNVTGGSLSHRRGGATNGSTGDAFEELRDQSPGREGEFRRPSLLSSNSQQQQQQQQQDSDDSDVDGTMIPRSGRSPRKRQSNNPSSIARGLVGNGNEYSSNNAFKSKQTSPSSHHQDNKPRTPPSLDSAPLSMLKDDEDAREIQKAMQPSNPTILSQVVNRAQQDISRLISIAGETTSVSEDPSSPNSMTRSNTFDARDNAARLAESTSDVVHSVRDLVYAAGTLCVAPIDLATLSELVSLISDESVDSGVVSTFCAAITALNNGQGDIKDATTIAAVQNSLNSTPNSIPPIGRKINSTLSKLVLWSRAVVEHLIPHSKQTPESGNNAPSTPSSNFEASEAQLEKALYYRQRMKEDAVELERFVTNLGTEAERLRLNSNNPSTSISNGWVRRIQGVLKSGNGIAGIGLEILGGGSSAGWRGNGFVLPNSIEATALRAEAIGGYNNPFDQTKETQFALASGKINLRRKPMIPLTKETFNSKLKPQQQDLVRLIDELISIIQKGGEISSMIGLDEDDHDRNENATPVTNSNSTNGINGGGAERPFNSKGSKLLISQVKFVLIRFGTFITLLEDLDLASSLDFDGPSFPIPETKEGEDFSASIVKAKTLVQEFSSSKQASYEISSTLLMISQEVSLIVNSGIVDLDTSDKVLKISFTLKEITENLGEQIEELSSISEEQMKHSFNCIGARAKVYGVEEFKPKSAAINNIKGRDRSVSVSSVGSAIGAKQLYDESRIRQGEAQEKESNADDVMYLGPGIAVPNGPPAGGAGRGNNNNNASASNAKIPNAAAAAIASRGGLRAAMGRPRSTSVTTGGSTNSIQSSTFDGSKTISSRRGTTAGIGTPNPQDSDDENDSIKNKNNKIKKFFGDDAPTEKEVVDANAKRAEEEPWFLGTDYQSEDIVMNLESQVKGATLSALMERLTMHNSFDASFNNTFLMTYRSFTTTEEFLQLLFERFRIEPPQDLNNDEVEIWIEKKQKPVRLRVFNVLKSWLETFFYQGEDDEYLEIVKNFALVEMAESPSMGLPSRQLLRLVERRQGDGEPMVRKMVMPTSAPPPILPKNLRKIKFLDIDPLEMARQLTILESKLYNRIKPVECLGKSWSKPDSDIFAKGIKDTINTSNRITGWVAEAILVQEDLKKRSAWIKQFVAIADRCRSLNNFSTMTAIVSGLNSAPVYRLRRTWDAVNQKNVGTLEALNKVMQSSKNFSDYREMIHKLNPPCVPFLGVYLTDLTFIEDGNPDRLKGDPRLINFGKRQKTAEVIREIMIYQSTPYNLTPVPGIQKFIDDNLVESRGDNDLYQQSLLLEPREREDEKIARLLQESGFL